MKKIRYWHSSAAWLLVVLAPVLIGIGCSDHEEGAHVEDPHAGHDHGPGEHGLVFEEESEDPHAGHDHGPGEHGEDDDGPDWCAEHAVPETACTVCHPDLIEAFKAAGDWCGGHGLPESHCRLCNPGISFPQEEILRKRSLAMTESDLDITLRFRPNASVCATDGALIQFASENTAHKTGLTVATARVAELERVLEAPAEVVFDESRSRVVTSTVAALVTRWLVSPGDRILEGELLAILSSPEIAELESQLLTAYARHDVQQKEAARHEALKEASLISDGDYERQVALAEQALAEYRAVRGLLAAAGLSPEDIADVVEHGRISSSFGLRAPADGVIVDRIAQLGELLDAGGAFALLSDPSSMWIEAQLTEEQLRQAEVGQTLVFASDGRGLGRVGAEVTWVSRFLDPHTRTGTVRARVVDPHHGLQAGEFGRAGIARRDSETVALVPKDAVQWEGCCNVVFVRESALRYRPRKVTLRSGAGPYYQVTGGVQPGDEVVVEGAFLLKTELKKASLGTGCCGLEPTG